MNKMQWQRFIILLPPLVLIALVETGRIQGFAVPAPFLLIAVSVVFSAGIGGSRVGLLGGFVVSTYIIYSSYNNFGPVSLTGGPVQVLLGAGLISLSGFLLGLVRDQRDKLYAASLDTQKILEEQVVERTAELNNIVERIRLQSSVIDNTNSGVLICEGAPDFEVIYVNTRFREIRGYLKEQILGQNAMLCFGELDEVSAVRIEDALVATTTFLGELTVKQLNSENEMHCRIKMYPLEKEETRTRFAFVLEDITALRETELQLHQAQRFESIGQLTGGIAHDFNNILGIVMGNLELAKLESHGEHNPCLDSALIAVDRGKELTYRLLAYARQQSLSPKVVNLSRLLQDVVSLLSRTLGDHIKLQLEVPDKSWPVEVDPGQLENVIVNLASNARDAMPNGGVLKIVVSNLPSRQAEGLGLLAEDHLRIEVIDAGQGMPSAIIERIFDPFFTTKEVGKGNGLGLSMAHGFVQQSGGQMRVSSEEGVGSSFSIYLPRTGQKSDVTQKIPVKSAALGGSGQRILLVEDEEELRKVMKLNLTSLGYDVASVSSAVEARSLLRAGSAYDLVITDINLPGGISGIELIQGQQQGDRLPAVILMSGYSDFDNPLNNLAANVSYIQKPFRLAELANLVQSKLDPDSADEPNQTVQ